MRLSFKHWIFYFYYSITLTPKIFKKPFFVNICVSKLYESNFESNRNWNIFMSYLVNVFYHCEHCIFWKYAIVCQQEGFGIGDDLFSLSYDGCRKLVWYNARPTPAKDVPAWRPGDVLGCLIDVPKREVIFSLNGLRLAPCSDIFETTRLIYCFF